MSDQPITLAVLAQFHRDVVLPDTRLILGEAIAESERRMQGQFDAILSKLGSLEIESAAIKSGLVRLEEKMGELEARMGGLETRMGVLEERVDRLGPLHADLLAAFHRLEERLSRVEQRLERDSSQDELRPEVERLRVRVEALHDELLRLERRIDAAR